MLTIVSRFGLLAVLFFSGALAALAHGDAEDGPLDHHDLEAIIASSDAPVTYYEDVQPILYENCVVCHQPGEIGGFSLLTYEDALEAAPVLADNVMSGLMPPQPPSHLTPALRDDRSLSDDEIVTLVRWSLSGAEGNPDNAADLQVPQRRSVEADLTLTLPEPYTPNDARTDDYRCFILDAGLEQDQFITGYDVIPGEPQVVHHVLLYQLPGTALAQAQAMAAQDAAPGYECFGGPRVGGFQQLAGIGNGQQRTMRETAQRLQQRVRGLSNSASLGGSIGAWVPGRDATIFPAGTGDVLRADHFLVLQVHYNMEAGGALPDQTQVLLDLADTEADLTALQAMNLVAPVEIPCPAGVDNPACDRDVAFAELLERDGRARASSGLLALCGKTLADYAGQPAAAAHSYCDRPAPIDGYVVGASGHMHERGTSFRITLNPDTPDAQILLDIPAWDFHWQGSYQYIEPLAISAGDTVRIECQWDNSDGERYILWAEGTDDEMCLGGISILPLPPGSTHEQLAATHPIFEEAAMLQAMQAETAHSGHMAAEHDHMAAEHDHSAQIDVPADAAPSISLSTVPNGNGGHILLLTTQNFRFAPENVDGPHITGEGHAHLYINGEKIGRMYGNAYDLGALPAGTHQVRVTLNANNHAEYTSAGVPIAAETTLTIE